MTLQQMGVLLAHGFVGWALCGAVMGISLAITSEKRAIVLHALAAPVIFGLLSWSYFTWFGYTDPVVTAAVFVSLVIAMDFFVVAALILGNYEMFRSFAGTWLPFILIAVATLVVGYFV